MELEIRGSRGIPQSGLLSISAGGMRKQVQLSSIDRPLRFPADAEISQIKVDVLEVTGRARLPYEAAEKQYTLPLEQPGNLADDNWNMEVDVVIRPFSGPDSPSNELDGEARRRKESDANGYLEAHGLVNFMQFLLHSLMQDKPEDPLPFIEKQVALRKKYQAGGSPSSPSAALPVIKGYPLLSVPTIQDSDLAITSLLERIPTSPQQGAAASPEAIAQLERDALTATQRLRADNAKLRETAEQMKAEYEKLMQESTILNQKLDLKRTAKREGKEQEAYREIGKLQEEIELLAKENAKLVTDLTSGREMIDLVRKDMLEIRQSVGE